MTVQSQAQISCLPHNKVVVQNAIPVVNDVAVVQKNVVVNDQIGQFIQDTQRLQAAGLLQQNHYSPYQQFVPQQNLPSFGNIPYQVGNSQYQVQPGHNFCPPVQFNLDPRMLSAALERAQRNEAAKYDKLADLARLQQAQALQDRQHARKLEMMAAFQAFMAQNCQEQEFTSQPYQQPASLLQIHCAQCHSGDRVEGGFDLADASCADLFKAIRLVRSGEMPPKSPLVDSEVEALSLEVEALVVEATAANR